jgi:hypothetical protein
MNEVDRFAAYSHRVDKLIDGATNEQFADVPQNVLLRMVKAERRGPWLNSGPKAPWDWRHR